MICANAATQFTELTRECSDIRSLGDFQLLLASAEPRDRIHALQNVNLFESDLVGPLVRGLVSTETNVMVQATAAKALARVGGPEDAPILRGFLRSADQRVRANAVEALGHLGGDLAEAVTDLGTDPSPRVRANVASVLFSRERAKALADLRSMIVSEEHDVSESALHALKNIGAVECLEVLELALGKESSPVRQKAFKVLSDLAESNPAARELLDRHRGGELDQARQRESLGGLCGAMNDRDPKVRLAALEALKDIDEEQARSRIELATGDADERVRCRASELLESILAPQEEKVALQRLGRMTFQLHQAQGMALPELGSLLEEIRALGEKLNRGAIVDVTTSLRVSRLVDLGRAVLSAYEGGRIEDSNLRAECDQVSRSIPRRVSPDPGRSADVPPGTSSAAPFSSHVTVDGGPEVSGVQRRPVLPRTAPSAVQEKPTSVPTRPSGGSSGQPSGSYPRPRNTVKTAVLAVPPSGMQRLRALVRQYYLLLVPGFVIVALAVTLTYAVLTHPTDSVKGPRPRGSKGSGASPVADEILAMSTAPDPSRYVGLHVHWQGKVTESNDAKDKLMVVCDGRFFAVRMEAPVSDAVKQGSTISVDGVVLERVESGVMILQGRRVELSPEKTNKVPSSRR